MGKKTTAVVDVLDQLRTDVITGSLPAGQRVTFSELASRYGTSQMPIREAVHQLIGEGLLIAEPYKGVRVRLVDATFINNVYDMRDLLKSYLVRRATLYISNYQIDQLRSIHDSACSAFSSADTKTLVHLHANFNRSIYDIARNPEATSALERTRPLTDSLRSRYGYTSQRLAEVAYQHEKLLEALTRRDAEDAAKWAIEASQGARRDLIAMLEVQAAA